MIVGDVGEGVREIGLWVDAVQLCGLDQRGDDAPVDTALVGAGEQRVPDDEQAPALADHLELDSFHLLGMSMGGAIAQEMALLAHEDAAYGDPDIVIAGSGSDRATFGLSRECGRE